VYKRLLLEGLPGYSGRSLYDCIVLVIQRHLCRVGTYPLVPSVFIRIISSPFPHMYDWYPLVSADLTSRFLFCFSLPATPCVLFVLRLCFPSFFRATVEFSEPLRVIESKYIYSRYCSARVSAADYLYSSGIEWLLGQVITPMFISSEVSGGVVNKRILDNQMSCMHTKLYSTYIYSCIRWSQSTLVHAHFVSSSVVIHCHSPVNFQSHCDWELTNLTPRRFSLP
jgi:hypothetical protein